MSGHAPTSSLEEKLAKFSGKQYFVCVSTPATPETWAPTPGALEAHIDWIAEQEAAGTLLVAGPFLAEDGNPAADGLIIFRADDLAGAQRIAAEDPFHTTGLRTFTIRGWSLNQGRISVAVQFSDSTATVD